MRLRASLAILLFATGCTTTHTIPKSELTRLDGWKDDGNSFLEDVGDALRGERKDVRQLHDTEGRAHKFNKDTPLVLVRQDGDELVDKYIQVSVDTLQFQGIPGERPGTSVVIPLEQVESVGVREFSWRKTLLLSGGIAVGLLGGLIALGLAADGGGGGDDRDSIPCGHGCSVDF